jgi:hypothetical protein
MWTVGVLNGGEVHVSYCTIIYPPKYIYAEVSTEMSMHSKPYSYRCMLLDV